MKFRAFIAGLCVALAPIVQAADVAISALPSAAALAGTEAVPAVQSGSTVKTTPSAIRTYTFGSINGIVKANGSGVPSAAVSGTDYAPATSGSSILKGNGSGGFSSAASGTDYAPATSGTTLLFGDGAGGHTGATGSSVSGANVTLGGPLTVNAGTQSSSAPSTFNFTFNNSGVTFEGLGAVVTETADAVYSKLFYVKSGANQAFTVRGGGTTYVAAENGYSFMVAPSGANVGTSRATWGSTGMQLGSAQNYTWSSSTDGPAGGTDTGFSRNAAGVIEANNGSAGTLRDLKLRSLIASDAASTIGYATGAGGTVTQATSKSTGVTLNKSTGQITTTAAALAATTTVTFTVTNSQVAATDTPVCVLVSGNATAGTYQVWTEAPTAGTFKVNVRNMSAGSLSEALVINCNVIKGASS